MKSQGTFIKFLLVVTIMIMVSGMSLTISAQEMGKDRGMMGGDKSEETVKMMQEPNKVLANGSIQYLTVFANLLYIQASQRRDQINRNLLRFPVGRSKEPMRWPNNFKRLMSKPWMLPCRKR